MKRRLLSALLTVCMLLTMLPVTAFAADASESGTYVSLEYETGALECFITVRVHIDGEVKETINVSDAAASGNTIKIKVNDNVNYEIDDVQQDGGVGDGTGGRISSDNKEYEYSNWAGANGVTFDVYLREPLPKPDTPDGVYEGKGSVFFYLYEDQLLKMLHLAEPESTITANTKIESVFLNFTKDVGAGFSSQYALEWHTPDANEGIGYYNSYGGISNIYNDVVPNNISSLVITYGNGQTATIPAGDLRCVNQEATGIGKYILKANNDTCYAVAFYDSGNTGIGSAGAYSLRAIAFVEPGQTVTQMPEEPEYIGYNFAGWSTAKSGGDPFNESYVVNSDMRVWAQKYTSDYSSSLIYVDNTNDAFLDRFVELYNNQYGANISVNDVNKDSVKIQVNGENEKHTNPNYYTSSTQKTGWDGEGYATYKIFNYNSEASIDENAPQYNRHIPFDEIQSITIFAEVPTDNGNVTVKIDIPKGSAPGEFGAVVSGYEGGTGSIDGVFWLKMNQGKPDDEPIIPPEPTTPAITGITKDLVESVDDLPAGVITDTSPYTFPEGNKVIIPYGESVTLLYAITVEGKENTTFTVTDPGAKLVQADSSADVTQSANDEGFDTFSGTIPEGGEAVFYVSKMFRAEEITDEGKLVNKAEITSGDVDPDEDEDTAEVDAEEESHPIYAYVQFIGSGEGGALTNDEKAYVETLGCTLHGNGYVAIGSFDWNIPDPSGSEYAPEEGEYASSTNFFEDLLGDSFAFPENDCIKHEHAGNNFPFAKVDWNKLTTAKGAGQFEEVSDDIICWHLDGQIKLYDSDISVEKELTSVQRAGKSINITEGMTLEVDDQLTWTITVTNEGNANATGLKLTDTLTANGEEILPGATVTASDGVTNMNNFSVEAEKSVEFTATYIVTTDDVGKTLKNTATVTNDDEEEEGEGSTENPVGDPNVIVTKTADKQAVMVGDTINYTITVENKGEALGSVTLTDAMWNDTTVASTVKVGDAIATVTNGSITVSGIEEGATVTVTYSYTVTDADGEKGEVANKVTVTKDNGEGDEDDSYLGDDETTVQIADVMITPADIVIYTGGAGYGGVTDAEGNIIESSETENGLPRPGYHIDLSNNVNSWLQQNNVSTETAADLAELLSFCYYDQDDSNTLLRQWNLIDQGVYSREGETVTAYVYSLSPNQVEGEFKDTEVRLQFTDNGEIITNDSLTMDENVVSKTYKMTIYGGGLIRTRFRRCSRRLMEQQKSFPLRSAPAT